MGKLYGYNITDLANIFPNIYFQYFAITKKML